MCPALDSLWMTVLGFEGMLAGPRAWILYSLSLLCLEVWQDSNWDKFSLQMDSLERRGFSHHTFNLVGNTEGRCITRQLKAADDILVEWEVYLLMWSKGSKEIHEGVKENGIKKKRLNNWMIDCIYPVLPFWRYWDEYCTWNCLSFPCPWMVFWSASGYSMVGSAFCRGHVML